MGKITGFGGCQWAPLPSRNLEGTVEIGWFDRINFFSSFFLFQGEWCGGCEQERSFRRQNLPFLFLLLHYLQPDNDHKLLYLPQFSALVEQFCPFFLKKSPGMYSCSDQQRKSKDLSIWCNLIPCACVEGGGGGSQFCQMPTFSLKPWFCLYKFY